MNSETKMVKPSTKKCRHSKSVATNRHSTTVKKLSRRSLNWRDRRQCMGAKGEPLEKAAVRGKSHLAVNLVKACKTTNQPHQRHQCWRLMKRRGRPNPKTRTWSWGSNVAKSSSTTFLTSITLWLATRSAGTQSWSSERSRERTIGT